MGDVGANGGLLRREPAVEKKEAIGVEQTSNIVGKNDYSSWKAKMSRATAADEKDPQLKSLYAEVGAQIKKLRVTIGLTQEQLSERSGVNRRYIVQIEKLGLNLTLELMHQLATGLGVRLQDLLNYSEGEHSDAELRLKVFTTQVMETLGSIQTLAKKQADSLAAPKIEKSHQNGRSQADH